MTGVLTPAGLFIRVCNVCCAYLSRCPWLDVGGTYVAGAALQAEVVGAVAVLLARQVELQVLLAELRPQEGPEHGQPHCKRERIRTQDTERWALSSSVVRNALRGADRGVGTAAPFPPSG